MFKIITLLSLLVISGCSYGNYNYADTETAACITNGYWVCDLD